ncbi:MAG: extracellular solute-binding protein [Paracoccaceae bacterium]
MQTPTNCTMGITLGRSDRSLSRAGLVFSLIFAATAWAVGAQAQEITKAHGYKDFGSLKYGTDMTHLDYVNPNAPKGGEIAIWAQGTFDSMNPYTIKGRAGLLSTIGFENLLVSTADEIASYYCFICETLEYPEDLAWVIFNMRDDVTFSDGTPMTAEDIVFSYDIMLEQGLPSYRAVTGTIINTVEVMGDYQIRFTFVPESGKRDRIPSAGFIPIFSKKWFDDTGARIDESRMEIAIGSGPYILDSFDVNQQIIYKRNPDYWGINHPFNIGTGNFDTIRVEYFGDSNAAFEGFKAGAYTFRLENSSKTWATGYDFPAIEDGTYFKGELPDGNKASAQSFVFNLQRKKFADVRVREAIGLMFNFEWSNETLFFGLYDRINSFWDNSELKAEGTPSEGELALLQPLVDEGLLPASILSEPAVMGATSTNRQLDRSNLRLASALLDEAGWEVGDDGQRRNAAGQTLDVEFLARSAAFDRIINPYVENLKALGVNARLNRIDPAQYTNRERAKDFDILTDNFNVGYEPGAELRQPFGSEGAEDSLFNTMTLKSAAVDRLIAVIEAIDKDKEKLDTAVRTLDRVLRAERFWVPQWYKAVHTVSYLDIFDHPDPLPPYSLGQLDFWWVNPDKEAAMKAVGKL